MVKQGYKQTEIGVIPQDWNVHTLEMLYNITSSKRVFQSQWRKSGIPFYRAREIAVMSEGKSAPEDLYIDADLYNQYTRQYGSIKKDDVLITGVGTLGKVYVVKESDKFYFKDGNIIWLQFKDGFSSQYLKHQYDMPVLINQVFGNAGGSTVATYTITNAKSTKVPVPPLDEQKRIAEALSDVDSMISSLEKLIAKKKAVKQGAMQELLTGKKRLPGFTGEWNTFVFGELFDFIPNNAFTRSQMSDSGNVKNIHYGDILTLFGLCIDGDNNSIPYINQDIDLTRFADRCYLQSGDVIIADTAEDETVGKALEIDNVNSPVLAGQHTLLCRSKIKFADKFLGYYLNAACYHDQLLPFIVGTKVSSVSKSSVAQTKLVVPDFEEQTAIASILSDMDNEIEALEQKLAKTRQIKQGMMQQLLTGKIRFTGKDEDIPRKRTLHSANIYFKRAVLAAEIASRLYQESTFGHVKMEKLLFLTEKLCDIDLNSNYHRDAAGPYDNRALRSIDSQLKKQKWFDVVTIDRARRYIPMEKSGTHSEYFKRYYNHILPTFNFIISTFQKMNTEQCEIVATLYSAWEDFLLDGCVPNDSMIVEEVLNNWHNSKKRISQERWESALNWMRQKNIIPKQRGSM